MEEEPRIGGVTVLTENIIREIINITREYNLQACQIVGTLEFIKANLISGDFYKDVHDSDED